MWDRKISRKREREKDRERKRERERERERERIMYAYTNPQGENIYLIFLGCIKCFRVCELISNLSILNSIYLSNFFFYQCIVMEHCKENVLFLKNTNVYLYLPFDLLAFPQIRRLFSNTHTHIYINLNNRDKTNRNISIVLFVVVFYWSQFQLKIIFRRKVIGKVVFLECIAKDLKELTCYRRSEKNALMT